MYNHTGGTILSILRSDYVQKHSRSLRFEHSLFIAFADERRIATSGILVAIKLLAGL